MSFTIRLNPMIGKRYSRLRVSGIGWSEKWKRKMLICECDCGNRILVQRYKLETGNTRSCGCLAKDVLIARNTKHLKCSTPEYKAWEAMKARCYNPRSGAFVWYGARGIAVCDSWLKSFPNFLKDMGARPSQKHTLERIDNSKGYSPSNCKWATLTEQNNNKRNNRFIEFGGLRLTITQWSRRVGLTVDAISARIKSGKPLSVALSKGRL